MLDDISLVAGFGHVHSEDAGFKGVNHRLRT